MKKLLLLLVLFLSAGVLTLMAQTRTITGTVTSAVEGEGPIPGVSVTVPGTTLGVFTDVNGEFTLNVPQNARTLNFSFIGMKTQEVDITGLNKVDIVMQQDLLNLDEVIVTGVAAGTPKKKMAVSVQKVDAAELQQVVATSASSALQGKVSGLTVINANGQPGSQSTILVRGATQISGSQDPLIILDGAIMEGTFADINVDDIESIEVVKGASAAALYGSRAGNGVIAVTTKRGNLLAAGRTEVTIRNEYGINVISKRYWLSEHHAYALADDQASYSFTKYDGVTYPADYSGTEQGVTGTRYLKADHYMDNEYAKIIDHEGEIFAQNNNYTNYVGIASNLGKTNFLASFENNKQSGILFETSGYKRNTFRLNVDTKISNKLTFSASNQYIKVTSQDPGGVSAYNGGMFFDVLLTEPDVDYFYPNADGQPYNFLPSTWNMEQENPLYQLWKTQDNNTRGRFMGVYTLKYNLTDFLNFEARYAFEKAETANTTYNPYDTYTRSGSTPIYSLGSLSMYDYDRSSQNAQFTANFNKKFGDFNTRAKLSYLFEKNEIASNQTNGSDFGLGGVPSFDAIAGNISSTSSQSLVLAKNYFAILYLDYKDKYIFDGMFRYDGSSLFGADARWSPYFRVSAAYRITEDLKIPGIQELKIRGAYGTAGQRPGFADQYEVMRISNGIASKTQLGNRLLKPSLSKELEVGLNIDFLNRFSFELVRSETNTSDQILAVPLAVQYGGWPSQVQNAGSLNSKVWESSLDAIIANSSNFTWHAGLVFDRVRTMITELTVPPYQTGPQGQEANKAFYIREGEVFGAMYGYAFVKTLDEMREQLTEADLASTWWDDSDISSYVVNSDGYVIVKGTEGTTSEAAVQKLDETGAKWFGKIGDSNPKFKLSLRNTLVWRGIGIYALVDWKNGGDVYNKSAQWLTRDDRHGMMDQYGKEDYLKKTIEYYKIFYMTNEQNQFWVEDGSYLKLRELSVSYSVPSKALKGFLNGTIKGIKLSLIGKNLYTMSTYTGYDPEVGTTNGTQYFSYDFMGYPNFKEYSASLELKF